MYKSLCWGALVVGLASIVFLCFLNADVSLPLKTVHQESEEVMGLESIAAPGEMAKSPVRQPDDASEEGVGKQGDPPRSPAWIELSSLPDAEDKERFAKVNRLLSQAGRPEIASNGRIRIGDLPTVRTIVDDALRRLDKAEDAYLGVANAVLKPLKHDLSERLLRGDREGLPLKSKENSARRRHPHEAISIVLYEGKKYVLRAGTDANPGLAAAGASVDSEKMRAIEDFDSLLRELVSSPR